MVITTEKDAQLLSLLKLNGRESVSSLARKMGVSRTTVQGRIKRLEENGMIAGYSLRLGADVDAQKITAFVEITLEPQRLPTILFELVTIVAIDMIHTVSGKYDLIVKLSETTPQRIDTVLDKIGQITGVTQTSSAIVLSTKLDR
ncbi:MAG: Lrp/AsnC family transcriptional regulator [Rhizobiaceae bacterium]